MDDFDKSTHIAGVQSISAFDAEDITVNEIINVLGKTGVLPNVYQLDEEHRLGRWESPSLDELLDRARIDLSYTVEHFIDFVGIPISRKEATKHFLICGTTGSGKTTLIKFMMAKALFYVGRQRNTRALIYDPKKDLASFLYGCYEEANEPSRANKIVKILNPFDTRCFAWNLAKDIRTKSEAKTLASIIIPDVDTNNPFFVKAARLILTDIIYSFILTSEKIRKENEDKEESEKNAELDWTLRDICAAFHPILYSTFSDEVKFTEKNSPVNFQIAEAILKKHPLTERTIAFINRSSERGSNNDVLLTLLNYLDELEAVAAAWDGKEKISFRDWLADENGQVLVLGSSAENEEALNAVNSAIVQFIGTIINDSEDAKHTEDQYSKRTWIFLDEFADLKIKNLERFLTKGRSKGVCAVLSFQDYASIKENYKENIASVITSCCNFKIFLQSDGEAAEWISKNIGKERRYEASYGKNESVSEADGKSDSYASTSGSQGSSSTNTRTKSYTFTRTEGASINISIQERDLIMPGDIISLRSASKINGIEGYVKCSQVAGKIWKFHYDWKAVEKWINIKSINQPNFANRIEEEGTDFLNLRLFTRSDKPELDDFLRFGIEYDDFDRNRRKREQKLKDGELKEFIEIIKWRGYMTDDEKSDYQQFSDLEKQTVDRYINEIIELTEDEKNIFKIFGVKEKKDK